MAHNHIPASDYRFTGDTSIDMRDKRTPAEILQSFLHDVVDVDDRYLRASLTADRLSIKVFYATDRGVGSVPQTFMGMPVIVMYPTYRGFERYWSH